MEAVSYSYKLMTVDVGGDDRFTATLLGLSHLLLRLKSFPKLMEGVRRRHRCGRLRS
ncbi:hypothetical protein M527_12775 [Sphingobium indicum IP26]|nr:hypothetical protein M527_29060 [Sphingobium indicum IP26]EPR18361.1 hypothetical protein M527_12775 [Sphingobium indicum IP26]EQB03651.1 hypothetical protein L286_11535 [Sphingobium sp. HDIP04]